jgi:hypothetical protein
MDKMGQRGTGVKSKGTKTGGERKQERKKRDSSAPLAGASWYH